MSKRVIIRISIAVSLFALAALAYSFFEDQKSSIEAAYYYWLDDVSYHQPNPNTIEAYPENKTGYYQFDPQTILASLDQGKINPFTPSSVDPNTVDTYYPDVAWTQSDFLRVANALSQRIWNEPLDLHTWDVYFILAEGDCSDHFSGFNSFNLTYYKTIKTGWETVYIARHIDLTLWSGVARWAGDGNFSTPFIFGWKHVEPAKFLIDCRAGSPNR